MNEKMKSVISFFTNPMHIIFVAMFSCAMSQSLVFAALPSGGRQAGLSNFQIGLISSVPAVFYVVASLILGSFFVQKYKIRCIRIGLLATALSDAIFGFVMIMASHKFFGSEYNFSILLLTRIVLNTAWGGMFPAAQAYVADSTSKNKRVGGLALLSAASSTGLVLGPTIIWFMGSSGPWAAYFLLSGITSATLLCSFGVNSARNYVDDKNRFNAIKQLCLLNKTSEIFKNILLLWPSLLSGFLGMICLTMVQQAIGFSIYALEFNKNGADVEIIGQLLSFSALSMLFGQWLIATSRVRLSADVLISIGGAIGALGVAFIPVALYNFSFFLIKGSLCLFGFGLGLLLPANQAGISIIVSSNNQAMAAGINGAAQGTGRLFGPLLGVLLFSWSGFSPYIVSGLIFIIILICGRFLKARLVNDRSL